MRRVLMFVVCSLAASVSGCKFSSFSNGLLMPRLTEVNERLDFNCVHQRIPDASAEADRLFRYARWLHKNNQLKRDVAVNKEVERLYRVAAENGQYKANINLQNGSIRGDFEISGREHLRYSQNLIAAEVAAGYYFVGMFLRSGSAGLYQDPEMSLRYFRKAADEGNAQAQAYVADRLAPKDIAPEVARKMRRCAAEQGHGEAAAMLAASFQLGKKYDEALHFLQVSAAAGYSSAASRLTNGFSGPLPSDKIYYLGLEEDLGRAERYEKIRRILANYSYADPKVPEINDILPLPPAPLPEWDGKLQWLEERRANIPPPKPDEALIRQLAEEKGLDPATGKPLPGSPAFSQASFPLMICYSGEACPEAGYWKVLWPSRHNVLRNDVTRHFEPGDIFPRQVVERFHLRPWPLRDKKSAREESVGWGLLG